MNPGRAMLLRYTSEDNFSDWVSRKAREYGWCGFAVRHSEGNTRGVHTLKRDGHSDAYGWPDWLFWRDDKLAILELKTLEGALRKDQPRVLRGLDRVTAPPDVGLMRPTDEDRIINYFRTGIRSWELEDQL